MATTIDEALKILQTAKEQLGGDACLILRLIGSGVEDADVSDLAIISDSDSRYVEVRVLHPYLQE